MLLKKNLKFFLGGKGIIPRETGGGLRNVAEGSRDCVCLAEMSSTAFATDCTCRIFSCVCVCVCVCISSLHLLLCMNIACVCVFIHTHTHTHTHMMYACMHGSTKAKTSTPKRTLFRTGFTMHTDKASIHHATNLTRGSPEAILFEAQPFRRVRDCIHPHLTLMLVLR